MPYPRSPFYEPDENLWVADMQAHKALAWCRERLGLRHIPIPVPIDVWIERPMGLRLTITDLSHLGPDTEGAAIIADHEIQIEQNLTDDDSRFRFACAHELGHTILHWNARKVFHEHTHIGRIHHQLYERQADRFASSLLMPLRPTVHRLSTLAAHCKMPPGPFLDALMREDATAEDLWVNLVLPDLETFFGLDRRKVLDRFTTLRLRRPKRCFLSGHLARRLQPPDPEGGGKMPVGVPDSTAVQEAP